MATISVKLAVPLRVEEINIEMKKISLNIVLVLHGRVCIRGARLQNVRDPSVEYASVVRVHRSCELEGVSLFSGGSLIVRIVKSNYNAQTNINQ